MTESQRRSAVATKKKAQGVLVVSQLMLQHLQRKEKAWHSEVEYNEKAR